jgi:hypothetical protein
MLGVRHQIRAVGHRLDLLVRLRLQCGQLGDTTLLRRWVGESEGEVLQGRGRLAEPSNIRLLAPKLGRGARQLPQPTAQLHNGVRARGCGSERFRAGRQLHVIVVLRPVGAGRYSRRLPQRAHDTGA